MNAWLAARVHHGIAEVAAEEAGLVVVSTQIIPGWGDIVFVTLEARAQGSSDRDALDARLRGAVTRALTPQRCSVRVRWLP
jgi:hypothetical protein